MSEWAICSKKFWYKNLKSNFLVCFIYVFFIKKMSNSLIPSFLMSDVSKSLRSLTKNERCERIAQVAHQKWANEQIARFFELIAHSLIFSQKTSDSLRKPMSEFPALLVDGFIEVNNAFYQQLNHTFRLQQCSSFCQVQPVFLFWGLSSSTF